MLARHFYKGVFTKINTLFWLRERVQREKEQSDFEYSYFWTHLYFRRQKLFYLRSWIVLKFNQSWFVNSHQFYGWAYSHPQFLVKTSTAFVLCPWQILLCKYANLANFSLDTKYWICASNTKISSSLRVCQGFSPRFGLTITGGLGDLNICNRIFVDRFKYLKRVWKCLVPLRT